MRVEGDTMRSLLAGVLMDIIAKLNEKLSKYRSPKLNWLTKRPVLLQWVGAVSAFVTTGVLLTLTLVLLPFFNTSFVSALFLAFSVIVTTGGPIGVLWWFEKQQTPKREKVIEKYTNLILKNFSESEYYEVKIKLLKILNSEPYTPVYFLDEMMRLKEIADQQSQREKDKHLVAVNDSAKLTVLIEQMEQNETAEQISKDGMRDQKLKAVFKL